MEPHRQSLEALSPADQARDDHANWRFSFGQTGELSLRNRFALLTVGFSIAIIVLVSLSYLGFQALSGARAYVNGESQYAKAQKEAVIALFRYANSGNEADFTDYHQALEVNLGDKQARLALDRPDPDIDAARQGFLAGGNHPDDIDLMIQVFRRGRGLPLFNKAVNVWERADGEIEQLERNARDLREAVEQYGPGSEPTQEVMSTILEQSDRLTNLQNEFSQLMGRLSHQLTGILSLLTITSALLLILAGILFATRLLRSAESAERSLRESEQRFRALVDQPEVGMWQLDKHGRVAYLNPAMKKLLGLDENTQVSGMLIEKFVAPKDRERVLKRRRDREQGQSSTEELEMVPDNGEPRQVLVHGAPVILDDGRLSGHVGTCMDITDRKLMEEQLRHQAFHDLLTGLPNRQLFRDRLEMALRRARRDQVTIAVLFVDLDRFKVVNDSVGHTQGDQLLREAARRLERVVRERDTIARIGGDEFAIILEQVENAEDTVRAASRIVDTLSAEFRVDDFNARIGGSVGIALSTAGEHQPSDLLRFADIAMYVAKRAGGGTWHVYDPVHDSMKGQRLRLEGRLWNAVENGELVLHYQPIVDSLTRKPVALEALVRWQHLDLGLLQPDAFISVAEETGAIVQIGRWVARQACRDLVLLRRLLAEQAPASMAVNISDIEFRLGNPADWIKSILTETGLPPGSLSFEVTEGLLMRNPEAIRALEQQGCPVAIDDFGTGYASLDMLRGVNFSVIKIDRTFIAGLPDNTTDRAIIESILQLGNRLGMRMVAEGVETEAQLQTLQNLGCELVQGYLFSRPMPVEQLVENWAREG